MYVWTTEVKAAFKIQLIALVQMWLNINGLHSTDIILVLYFKSKCKHQNKVGLFLTIWMLQQIAKNYHREHLEKYMPPEYVPKYKDGTLCIFPACDDLIKANEEKTTISFNIKIM